MQMKNRAIKLLAGPFRESPFFFTIKIGFYIFSVLFRVQNFLLVSKLSSLSIEISNLLDFSVMST